MANAQDQINAQMQKFQQAWGYPTQQMGVLQSALGMTPYGQSTTGASDTQTYTPTDWAALAGAGIGALGSIFQGKSDKRLKKNLQKLGVHPATKTPIYAFNWKGEPPGAPKSLGPMAQDLAKTVPGSVAKHPRTGVLHVHPAVLGAMARPAPAGTLGAMAIGKPAHASHDPASSARPAASSRERSPVADWWGVDSVGRSGAHKHVAAASERRSRHAGAASDAPPQGVTLNTPPAVPIPACR